MEPRCETPLRLLLLAAFSFRFRHDGVGAVDFQFSSIGQYRFLPPTAAPVRRVESTTLGTCCGLCTADGNCAGVNYFPSTKSCELFGGTGTWSADSTSLLFFKIPLESPSTVADLQAVAGVFLQAGREEGYRSFTSSKAANAEQCRQLCDAVPGKCQFFSYNSVALQCYVSDVDFYNDWNSASSTDASWTSYYKRKPDGWKLLYKISKGIGVDASDAFLVAPGNPTASYTKMAADSTCACYVKNGIVNNWAKFPITQVSVVLATGGVTQKYLNFSSTGETAATFFKQSNIIASSWSDLTATSPVQMMSIGTSTANFAGRYFLVVRSYSGCNADYGWISVSGQGTGGCTYDKSPVPQFSYAPGSTYVLFVSSPFADALLIYAKM